MDIRQTVWMPDGQDGYVLATIMDIGQDQVTVKSLAHPTKTVQTSYGNVYPAEEDNAKDVADNCSLMYLNEATLLNNLRVRYKKDQIYTFVANILIAINPYFEMAQLYSPDVIKMYQGKSLGVLPPHVFAIADKAFRDMRALKECQSVIVSGESGAGKTESTKYVLRYLCESWGSQSGDIEKLILSANPLLEAFGNAKTVRNNNSSRFGKFIEIHFNGKFSVVGGYISHYLLEKSRICGQGAEERNYHIFYQLCAGLDEPTWASLGLGSPDDFHYLAKGCTQYFTSQEVDRGSLAANRKSALHAARGAVNDPIVDDIRDFRATELAFERFGVGGAQRQEVYKIVAAILHLGNVAFEESPDDKRGGCRVKEGKSSQALAKAASLIGVDGDELRTCLLARIMTTSKGGHKGTVYLVPLKVHEAQNARDALAKAIYSKLFDHLVTKVINKSIPFSQSAYYIGFCINYCNEKLQQFFNERILKEEQALYEREGLGLKAIAYIDNQDCIDLLEAKSVGIFDLLDEESKLPKASSAHFTETVHSRHVGHFRLDVPRKSKLKDHREIRDDEGFLVRHFAGAVCYSTCHFVEKNSDALHGSLAELMTEAGHGLIKLLFTAPSAGQSINNGPISSSSSKSSSSSSGKLASVSVGGRFRTQLGELMAKLRTTGTHFIRCIKPNLSMVARKFEGSHILSQLQCSGMNSVLELMQQGYPSRTAFAELYNMYKDYLPPQLARLDARMFCRALFKALGLNDQEFRFGSTKVFFRPGKFAEFDAIMKSDAEHLAQLVAKVRTWLLRSRWKKAQWCALSVVKLKNKILWRRQFVIALQSHCRRFVCQKKFKPRYTGLVKLKKLLPLIQEINLLATKLKDETERKKQSQNLDSMNTKVNYLQDTIKADTIDEETINAGIGELNQLINGTLAGLRGKINEEQETLKRLEAEMESERKRKEDDERKMAQEEEIRRRKQDLEKRCLEENIAKLSLKTEPESRNQAQADPIEDDFHKAMASEQARAQQEQQDYQLAIRLARETGPTGLAPSEQVVSTSQVSPMMLQRSPAVMQQREALAAKKYDLSKWKYSELRDTINTSCDIELLEACREEFHRRLKVYHEWKAKNSRPTGEGEGDKVDEQRAPHSVMQHATVNGTAGPKGGGTAARRDSLSQEVRFFRIPFVRPSVLTGQKGWWFAHFQGQWIARQMELHPEKAPILLVAGKDDMQMCELSLEETRLTTKRGAEILPEEFEREWTKNGGAPWTGFGGKKHQPL
ncbi:Unconventional myosin-VI [Halotydeus destructor]|nr:Unconventional myosin-VI [Halotydeus destructor]